MVVDEGLGAGEPNGVAAVGHNLVRVEGTVPGHAPRAVGGGQLGDLVRQRRQVLTARAHHAPKPLRPAQHHEAALLPVSEDVCASLHVS